MNFKDTAQKAAFLFLSLVVLLVSSVTGVPTGEVKHTPEKSIKYESVNPNLQTVLQNLSREASENYSSAKSLARKKGLTVEEETVEVIIEPAGGRSENVDVIELKSLGAEVANRSESLIRAKVPMAALNSVSRKVKGVDFIRRPYKPRTLKVDKSEGVDKTGADNYQEAGYTGEGIKVGIIDLGFDHLTEAKESGDLPPESVAFEKDYTGSGKVESFTYHGTDVAEIVHDMAPDAQLYLMRISTSVGLEEAKNDAIAKGVDVINHSVGWYNTAFYDGTGVIADIAGDARDQGILWVNAAGNAAGQHWQGDFTDNDGDRRHEFGNGDECHGLGEIEMGNAISLFLTWDAWPKEPEDYDIYLRNDDGEVIASSDDNQTGDQPPTELLQHYVTTTDNYCFSIYNRSAPDTPSMETFIMMSRGSPSLEYPVTRSSITSPANDEKVITVGAIDESNWANGPAEDFSSRGPTNDSQYSSSRTKPDIMAPDAVSTSGYGSFSGTSAAAPHIAGAAALLLSAEPTRTPSDVQTLLESNAPDMGAPGNDNIYGSGQLKLGNATPPPALVTNFTAGDGEDLKSTLSWTNPADSDLTEVVVRRKTEDYPTNHSEGVAVYEDTSPGVGDSVSYKDEGLTSGTTYYYAVFGKGEAGNWNNTVQAGQNAATARPLMEITLKVESSGWNLVSVPITPQNQDPTELFSDVRSPNEIYHWDQGSNGKAGKFLSPDNGLENITALHGFWLYMEKDEVPKSLEIKGTSKAAREIVLDTAGWHQVGSQVSYHWEDVGVRYGSGGNTKSLAYQMDDSNEQLISRYLFEWDSSDREYVVYDAEKDNKSLEPGEAYWVRSYEDDVRLVIPFNSSSNPAEEESSGTPLAKLDEAEVPIPPAPPLQQIKEEKLPLETYVRPNPASGEKITFGVSGFDVKEVKLISYRPNGEKIYESPYSRGKTITWDLKNEQDNRVPNGIYLYRLKAKIAGNNVKSSAVEKFLFLK